jgi:DNA-binding transcriptional regulator/RsmH inhibitor MraZ
VNRIPTAISRSESRHGALSAIFVRAVKTSIDAAGRIVVPKSLRPAPHRSHGANAKS